MWGKLKLDPVELNLAAVLRCGQSFRWRSIPGDEGSYSICMQNRVLFVRQDSEHLYYRSEGPGNSVSDSDLVRDYFHLKIGLKDLYSDWLKRDPFHFKNVHLGVRILNQDPWETLCAFICSSNNNIKRISKMVEALCTEYGNHVATIDGHAYHDFPTAKQLAKCPEKTEQALRSLGFGYRAKYLAQTAVRMLELPEDHLLSLRSADTEEVINSLLEFSGVGPKVADCVALMSLKKHGIVPIDTHMYQIASRDYRLKVTQGARGYKDVQSKLKGIWGEYAGWAHSVLFAGDLPDLKAIKRLSDLPPCDLAPSKHPKLEVKAEHSTQIES